MSNWQRTPNIDDSFKEMHGIKPKVSYDRVNNNSYSVKLELGGKEVILHEELDRGRTKLATLVYQGKLTAYPSVYLAECAAVKIFKGEE